MLIRTDGRGPFFRGSVKEGRRWTREVLAPWQAPWQPSAPGEALELPVAKEQGGACEMARIWASGREGGTAIFNYQEPQTPPPLNTHACTHAHTHTHERAPMVSRWRRRAAWGAERFFLCQSLRLAVEQQEGLGQGGKGEVGRRSPLRIHHPNPHHESPVPSKGKMQCGHSIQARALGGGRGEEKANLPE